MRNGDDAGSGAAEIVVERLRRAVFQVDVIALSNGSEPDQLSADELCRILNVFHMAEA